MIDTILGMVANPFISAPISVICFIVLRWCIIRNKPFYTKHNLPIISFQQFCSLYPLAPDKWKYKDEGYGEEWLEYVKIDLNPCYNDELRKYNNNLEFVYNKYGNYFANVYKEPKKYVEYIQHFTFTKAEHKDFVKFFKKLEQDKLERQRNEALVECLPYWQEDINEAKRKSEEMLKKASETYQIYSTKFGY